MATRLTESAVRELLALEAQATPGPWPVSTASSVVLCDDGGWAAIGPQHECLDETDDEPGGPAELEARADEALMLAARNLSRPLAESWLEMRALLRYAEEQLKWLAGDNELCKKIRNVFHDDGDHEPRAKSGWTMDVQGALVVAQNRIRELESGAVLAEKLALQRQVQALEQQIKSGQ